MLRFPQRAKENRWSDCSPQSWEPLALMLALWEACVLTSPLGLALPTALGSCFLWLSNFVELNARALISVIIIVIILCRVKNPLFSFLVCSPKYQLSLWKHLSSQNKNWHNYMYFFRSIPYIPFSDFVSVWLICIWGNPWQFPFQWFCQPSNTLFSYEFFSTALPSSF